MKKKRNKEVSTSGAKDDESEEYDDEIEMDVPPKKQGESAIKITKEKPHKIFISKSTKDSNGGSSAPTFAIEDDKKESPTVLALKARMDQMEMEREGKTKRFNTKALPQDLFEDLDPKFKFPDMPKFDGSGDAVGHLKMYYFTMSTAKAKTKHMALLFAKTLTECALDWYNTLPKSTQDDWDLICDAFQTQFEDNMHVKPTRRDLR